MPHGVPFLFVLRAWRQAINLGGPGGAEPTSPVSQGSHNSATGMVFSGRLGDDDLEITVHCLRVRSQSFFSPGMPVVPLNKQEDSRTRLHP
jgi:hypothetical protein